MINYESLGITELYQKQLGVREISDGAVERIKEAWQEREAILFQRANGTPIFILGAENKKENGEWFVEITSDGFPETIIGGTYDLIEYLEYHFADWFEVLEIQN